MCRLVSLTPDGRFLVTVEDTHDVEVLNEEANDDGFVDFDF